MKNSISLQTKIIALLAALIIIGAGACLIILLLLYLVIAKLVIQPVHRVVGGLRENAEQLLSAADNLNPGTDYPPERRRF